MRLLQKLFGLLLCSVAVSGAHPMGNFSVSHFSRLHVTPSGVELQYVLDLAEIPTFELLRTWQMERSTPAAELDRRAAQQAREWLGHLSIASDGHPVRARYESSQLKIADGAGNLPILRLDIRAHVDSKSGALVYKDDNFSQRAGWKEIVVSAGSGASLVKVSQSDQDLSQALTHYPPDPTVAPPQDLWAELTWRIAPRVVTPGKQQNASAAPVQGPVVASIAQPRNAPAAVAPATLTAQGAPAGAVTRGDFLSRLLHQKTLSLPTILIALLAAFGLGALHALTPGHGKAIVAAYLVGSRGTLKHAVFLGAMVTFTHTISVFSLGLATLFLFRFIVPEKITVMLGALSGISIVVIGALMFYKRLHHSGHTHSDSHDHTHAPHTHVHADGTVHTHSHPHTHTHEPSHSHAHEHVHTSGVVTHSHGLGSHTHAHMPDEISWGGLVALGASGGLVPCESALVLLLGAIALGRVGLGLLLLVAFSLGLALVLMLIGVLVLYAKNLLPAGVRSNSSPWLRWMSIASPAIVMIVGLLMTAASLGWIQSKWMVG